MQQSMQQLQSSGMLPPGGMGGMGGMPGMGMGGMGTGTPNPAAGGLDFSALLGGAGGVGAGGTPGVPGIPAAAPVALVPPQERFATQLSQLEAMGFVDNARNIRVLTATNGDVNNAIERLLSGA